MLSTHCFTSIGPFHFKPSGQLLCIHWMPHAGRVSLYYDHNHQLRDLIRICLQLAIEPNLLDGSNTHSGCMQVLANTSSITTSILYTQLEMVDTTFRILLERAIIKARQAVQWHLVDARPSRSIRAPQRVQRTSTFT